jgi:3'(2'), 5'-bisphosphate nucleotidase
MGDVDPWQWIEAVIEISHQASRRILDIYGGKFSIVQKHDYSPVTEADLASHDVIREGLARLTPDIPVLSEEDSRIPFAVRSRWRQYWLVDPLDGTREFIKRNDEFTVNIAFVSDHQSRMGVICVPVSGVCYYAAHGHGAFKQEKGEQARAINTRRWGGRHITVAGSRSHVTRRFEAFLAGFHDHEIISKGSSLKSCLVAEGRADVYARFGPTSEWDTAAAQCIVEEAGGRIVDLNMRPLEYNHKESLLNPEFLVVGDGSHDWAAYLPDLS